MRFILSRLPRLSPLFVGLFMASSVLAGGASLAWGQQLAVTVTNVTKSEYSPHFWW